MRALLCSSIRVIGRSRMGMFFSNLGFLVSMFNLEPGTCPSRALSCLHQGSGDIRVCLDHIGIAQRFQSKLGCRLCSSVLIHGWLVAAVAKAEHFFINMIVRIDVSQGINLTMVEVLVNLLRILFIPLREVIEAFLGNIEFFFCFSFTHFAVEIDLLDFLVELGEIVRTEVLHRDPVFDDSFPGGIWQVPFLARHHHPYQ